MVTAHDPDDPESPRVARHLARFAAGHAAEPGDWRAWQDILADRSGEAGEQINVVPRGGFGTVCSSLLALPQDRPARCGCSPPARRTRRHSSRALGALH